MTTSSTALAAELEQEVLNGTIAEIRDDFRLDCPKGYVCEGNKQADCDEIRKMFNDTDRLNMGDIMAGIWCPVKNTTLANCPIGHFCNTSRENHTCPQGWFCPHKTVYPEIRCPHCAEGATELVANPYGYYVLYVVLCLVVCYVLGFSVFRYYMDQMFKLSTIQKRTLGAFKKFDIFDNQTKRMKRIRPTLENLARKMEENNIGTKKVKNDILKIPDSDDPQFHSQALRALFNSLDHDDSGTLSYNEFNTLLGMNQVQLQQFIGGMNSRAGLDYDTKVLTRAVFVKNFLPVLEECSHFSPTEEDARELFDEMAKYERENKQKHTQYGEQPEGPVGEITDDDDKVEIRFETFREQDFFHFLSQQQTNDLMKRFRWLRTKQDKQMQKSQSDKADKGGRMRRATMLGGGFTKEQSVRDGLTIGREEFVKNYPKLLKEVVTTNAARRDSRSGESSQIDEECDTIDIAFEDLSLSVEIAKTKVYIVDHVTGRLRAKTMTALMGGSGAGKTSLLNALCGRAFYGTVEGKIWINGIQASIEEHKDAVGFVPQDDTVYAELTVKENLIYSGKFRSERSADIIDIEDHADSILAKLGLSRVANTIVGDVTRRGVSGGEKKRVNIGIELMGKPSIIFLDEPTSGLDASSALLVMQSLKKLVKQNGVTVCAVIHQPRKVIFDLFDSLILLSVGGKMCFHGPTDKAKDYFHSRGYQLPEGESVADWLIDISTGQLAPDEELLFDNQAKTATTSKRASTVIMGDSSDKEIRSSVNAAGASNLGEEESDIQAFRREQLSKGWIEYFDKKNKNITKKSRHMYYSKPPETELPRHIIKPTFLDQFVVQLDRALKVGRRNIFSKFVDTCIIVFVGIVLTMMQGPTVLSVDADPQGIRLKYLVTESPELLLNDPNNFFEQLFAYAMGANEDFRQYGLKAGVVLAVIVGLTATKPMTEKRIEFFREAGSGYDVNAYFLAINVVTTVEHSVQLILVGSAAYWLRASTSGRGSYYASFLLLAWLTVSWALLLAVVVPPKNIFNIVGFFMAFTGLLFSGASPPLLFEDIYSSPFIALFCGFFSPTRYFTEGLAVSEHRCMPVQSGFTQVVTNVTNNIPADKNSFAILSLAQNDSKVIVRSCNGWFWYVLPAFMVGLTIRIAAGGLIHVVGRAQQAKRSFFSEIRREFRSNERKTALFSCLLYLIVLLGSIAVSSWLILRKV